MDSAKANDPYADQGPAIIGVSVGLLGLAVVLVLIRLAYRVRTHAVGADDYLIFLSVLLSVGHSVTDVYSVRVWGYGKHKIALTPDQASAPGQALGFWLAQLMYKLVLALTKLSICFLYHRLFQRAGRSFKIALYGIIALISLYYLGAWIATIFQCVPVRSIWMKEVPGTCINITLFFYVNAGFNIFTDCLVMALPVPIIYALHLPGRQKIALCLVFAVGLIATATSVVRIFTLNVRARGADPTWEIGGSTLWSSAEINTAIICACLPVLKGPLQAVAPRLFGSRRGSSTAVTSRSGGTYDGGAGKGGRGRTFSSSSDGTRIESVQDLVRQPRPTTLVFSDGARMGEPWQDKAQTHLDSASDLYALEGADAADKRTLRGSQDGKVSSDEVRAGILKSVGYKVSFEANDGSGGRSEPKGIAL